MHHLSRQLLPVRRSPVAGFSSTEVMLTCAGEGWGVYDAHPCPRCHAYARGEGHRLFAGAVKKSEAYLRARGKDAGTTTLLCFLCPFQVGTNRILTTTQQLTNFAQ